MKTNDKIKVPQVKFLGNQANIFYCTNLGRIYPESQGDNLKEDRKKAYQGFISKASKSKIKEKLSAWCNVINCYNEMPVKDRGIGRIELVLITLTLSGEQQHTDKWIKRNMLELFLKRLQYHHHLTNYFWVAEKQNNGNLHFHIITDVYIPKHRIQYDWNEIQRDNGYLDNFYNRFFHYNAPSTRIEMVKGRKNTFNYLMKYVTKSQKGKLIEGRCFAFSKKLNKICLPTVQIDNEIANKLSLLHQRKGFNLFEDEWYSVVSWKNEIDFCHDELYKIDSYKLYFDKLAYLFYNCYVDYQIIEMFTHLFFHAQGVYTDYYFADCYREVSRYLDVSFVDNNP